VSGPGKRAGGNTGTAPRADSPNRLLRHVGAVDLGKVRRDLAVGQPLGRQRQDQVVNPGQPTLTLTHDLRLERTGHIPRHPDLDRPDVSQHSLGPGAVTTVAAALARRVVLAVPDMVGDLTVQCGLQNPLGQLLQQAALTGQLQPVTTSPVYQHRDQLLVRDRTGRPRGRLLLNSGLGRHLASLP
jgi:hypothetical protein